MTRNTNSYNNFKSDKVNNLSQRTYSTKAKHWSKGLITPISLMNKFGKLKLVNPVPIFTMDLETININNVQVPIAISSCGVNKGKLESKLFLIDHLILNNDVDLAVKTLWNKYFNSLENLELNNEVNKLTIFAHNLGDFDGYFLYKALMNQYKPENVTSIIDESNSFISIKLLSGNNTGLSFEFKDSLRIFPMSLNKLCAVFGVEGKLIPYNSKFNKIELFNKGRILGLFKKYALQDAKSLYQALFTAQLMYFSKFGVDIESENFTRYFVTDNRKVYQIDISFTGLVKNVTVLGIFPNIILDSLHISVSTLLF